ncbi:uncharacterized protein LOC128721235 [Anopheles nili]|uniref:uncharacterized protein LOC128721235 n=1 Tax=Anopheles nili TaxID=185578 RepID=UPI00237B8B19|nr:uncharacterized protein LOC128721235 [Anopheles nili]
MSILLHETGGGSSGSKVSAATATTPIEDSNDSPPVVTAADPDPTTSECCTGKRNYGLTWEQCVLMLAQKTVLDDGYDGDGEETIQMPPENGYLSEEQSVPSKSHSDHQQQQHNNNLFPLKCCCSACIVSREMVMQLYIEDCRYNSLWDRLQLLMKQYYDLIPESEDNALYNEYVELLSKSSLKWFSDARSNKKNIIQMSLASNLPLSNEMAFVMLTNVLSTRDPHQLFELLCFQLRSIVQAYGVGFESLFTENPNDGSRTFNAPEVLNYIVNGYKKLCQSARTVTPLLFELEQRHLAKFKLSWWLINQRIFQRYFYYEVQSILPECMLRLRGALPEREYQEQVGRFLKFDKEMTDVSLSWSEVWPLLYNYHRAVEDCERRYRLNRVHSLLQTIRMSGFTPKSAALFDKREFSMVDCMDNTDRKFTWEFVVHCLQTKWIPGIRSRLSMVTESAKCATCNLALNTHNIECRCQTCIIGGGIFTYRPKKEINERCLMCSCVTANGASHEKDHQKMLNIESENVSTNGHSLLESALRINGEPRKQNGFTSTSPLIGSKSRKEDNQDNDTLEDCIPLGTATNGDQELYHIAWAVFKHLPDRIPYKWDTLEPYHICSFQAEPCSVIACRVAMNVVAMQYPTNMSRLLIESYQPVGEKSRRIMADNWNAKARNSLRKFCDNVNKRWHEEIDDQIHPLQFIDMFWSPQNSTVNLSKTRASELAEWFMFDTQIPKRNVFYQYFTKFFLLQAHDIELDLKRFKQERELSEPSNRMCDSVVQKHDPDVNILEACPMPLLSSATSSTSSSSSSSSSSCLSSSSSPSCSACSLSTVPAASPVVAAAAAAAAASSPHEPPIELCDSGIGINTIGECSCTCNRCVVELLAMSEKLSKKLDTPRGDMWTQRTNMLEKELKALLKERNMLQEMKREMHDQHHAIDIKMISSNGVKPANDEANAMISASEVSKDVLNVMIDLSDPSTIVLTELMREEVLPVVASIPDNEEKPMAEASDSNLPEVSKPLTEDVGTLSCQEKHVDTSSSILPASVTVAPSKSQLNESHANVVSKTPNSIISQRPIDLQTPVKLSAFAKMAASKIPTAQSDATAKPSPNRVAAPATSVVPKPKQTAGVSQCSNVHRPAPPTVTTAQANNASKLCPCGIPSHASAVKGAPGTKTKLGTCTGPAGHVAGATHTKEDHKKSCHRNGGAAGAAAGDKAEGSCVCYYCTLFGQSVCLECNHNQRTNETREKLRKKLQMKNDKIFNEAMEKQRQLMQKNSSTSSTPVEKVTKPPSTSAVANGSAAVVAPESASKPCNASNKTVQATGSPSLKPAPAVDKAGKKASKSASVATPGNVRYDQSIDDLLRYIEGDGSGSTDSNAGKANGKSSRINPAEKISPKNPSGAVAPTLPATTPIKTSGTASAVEKESDTIKKAKLNENLKLISELDFLREVFYDCQKQEQQAEQLLQNGSFLTKKERKELQANIQAYRQKKNDMHAGINVLVSNIRCEIPEYPFKLDALSTPPSCCPPAQHQQHKQPTPSVAREPDHAGMRAPSGVMPPPPPSTLSGAGKASSNVRHASTPAKPPETMDLFQQENQHDQMLQQRLQQMEQQKTAHGDPASRQMVTIKRTFLPHTEPQVTVTAKGESPEQDQILYTFVNGQMVPINGPAGVGDILHHRHYQQPQWSKVTANGDCDKTNPPSAPNSNFECMLQKFGDPLVEFSPQEQRIMQQYFEQFLAADEPTPNRRSSRSKKKSSNAVEQQLKQALSYNELIQDRVMRKSEQLIHNLQNDRKGNPEILTFAHEMQKALLEIQKQPKGSAEDDGGGVCKGTVHEAPRTTKKEPTKTTVPSDSTDRAGGKAKITASAHVESGKGKKKRERKTDKLKDEIEEIVARLNLLDSDEEESKPAVKRKQKAATDTKALNRKQSKDSIVSGSSGSGCGVKQQPKSQAKQQPPVQQQQQRQSSARTVEGKQQPSQESQSKKKEKSTEVKQKDTKAKSSKCDPVARSSQENGKAQQQKQHLTTVDAVATKDEPVENPVVRKKPSKTFIDPEFDNNAFRLLNLDESESEADEEDNTPEPSLKVESTPSPEVVHDPKKLHESCKDTVQALKDPQSSAPVAGQQRHDKAKSPPTSGGAGGAKVSSEKERKGSQKKPAKQERDSNQPSSGGSSSTAAKQQKRDADAPSGKATVPAGNDPAAPPKKLTPAQAMVEKISALLDSPGLSNRQRKQMIRQLEQAQATIQTQLLQNAAKAAKAKVQAQAQQEKALNQKVSSTSSTTPKPTSAAGVSQKPRSSNVGAAAVPSRSDGRAPTPSGSVGMGSSLMEQLRRGIRAEVLDLPPGITLTRLDAIQSEALRLKRESIPMKTLTPPVDSTPPGGAFGGGNPMNPGMFVVNPMSPIPAPGQESVIMVNTGKLRGKEQSYPDSQSGGDRKKRNKRRNKNKTKDAEANGSHAATTVPASAVSAAIGIKQRGDGGNIVTLRNPMFHGGSGMATGEPMRSVPGAPVMPDVQGARMTLGYDQPATIFKNDNGMFTIRNPALHHALSGGAPPEATGFRPFNAAYLVENGIMAPSGSPLQANGVTPMVTAAVSAGSGTTPLHGTNHMPAYLQHYQSPVLDDGLEPRKCKSVIGSEMKNAQKQKQHSLQQGAAVGQSGARSWNGATVPGHDLFATGSPSSAIGDGMGGRGEPNYSGFNHYGLTGQELLHSGPVAPAGYGGGSMLGSSGYYPGTSGSGANIPKGAASPHMGPERPHGLSYLGGVDATGCAGSLATHCCDDDGPPGAYFNGGGLGGLTPSGMSAMNRYDDLAFLQNLQPGQRLNSEVTIHSINESKMRRQQAQSYAHDIQITPIPAPTSPGNATTGCQAMAAGSTASGSMSLQHMMHAAKHHTHRQQQVPRDNQLHMAELSPSSGSVGSGSGSITGAGRALNDFLESRASGGSSSSISADFLATSLELDTKNYLHDYQLGQLEQQMHDLQLQSQQQQQQLSDDYRDHLYAPKQPVSMGELDTSEYFFPAPSGSGRGSSNSSSNNNNSRTAKPIGTSAMSTAHSASSIDAASDAVDVSAEECNPGGVSIGGEELQRPQQPPIGTPSYKNHQQQQQRLQQNETPGAIMYPATADSPASSVSVFDGISSSLSSQAHSFDDLCSGLPTSSSPPSSIFGGNGGAVCGVNLNAHLNIHQVPHVPNDRPKSGSMSMLSSGVVDHSTMRDSPTGVSN